MDIAILKAAKENVMRTSTAILAAGALAAVSTMPVIASAETVMRNAPSATARHWSGYGHYPGYRPNPYHHRPYYGYYGHRWHDNDTGAAVAAGIAGLAVGTIIAGAANSRPTYYAYSTAPQPWTPAWYAYCERKYRSFDPRSGTFLGYDGNRHYCR